MSTLHTVNKSPFENNSLTSCLQLCSGEDSILLIEDGTYGGCESSPCREPLTRLMEDGINVYVLENDASARGLHTFLQGVELVDYPGFVKLSCTHQCIQSWY
ncbi:sulfurtransferase complex subunit TusB [Gilvimarinus agarilyticus]|uniref:sulfurtransferase complex subunit TusB n=1 Tax=unclassified Gilvimarinus TaxID=2642066 RepID=UPI001C09B184|nr:MULTISPECIES: sulfurtransferase complex subunit TusB [unclassified Gilvimarinus]MBU2887034.1 sulfurtransferase complex subunit TusB [Gilvimarinus agarilyticus]MDO6571694.1 sulfurtransferase complex subunit TusB [Gilvimarinus sp. 2_MG-2023]MDO6745766.1 sulfurtransferase complex subunit TusB [Gilvimarinus sp. 1_MG-2023]